MIKTAPVEDTEVEVVGPVVVVTTEAGAEVVVQKRGAMVIEMAVEAEEVVTVIGVVVVMSMAVPTALPIELAGEAEAQEKVRTGVRLDQVAITEGEMTAEANRDETRVTIPMDTAITMMRDFTKGAMAGRGEISTERRRETFRPLTGMFPLPTFKGPKTQVLEK